MWKSVLYKEWLKVRWFLIIYAGFGILAVGYIFLNVQHNFTFNEANNYWYQILFMGYQYFSYLKFAPVAGALAIAIAQYFPETVNKRVKLTFHLPINENKVLVMMMLFGTACLIACFGIIFLLFVGLSAVYFPTDIIVAAIISITPWFLSGFAVYFLVALIVLEPVWKYRFLYLIVAAAFVPIFMEFSLSGGYAPANPVLLVLVLILSIALLFSGYRFRKGEM
jgi:hypothetical protein